MTSLIKGIYVDIGLQIHFLHTVPYERLEAINSTTANVSQQLKSIFRELQELKM